MLRSRNQDYTTLQKPFKIDYATEIKNMQQSKGHARLHHYCKMIWSFQKYLDNIEMRRLFLALDIRRAFSASAVSPLLCDNLSFTNKTIAVGCDNTKKSFNQMILDAKLYKKALGKYIKTITDNDTSLTSHKNFHQFDSTFTLKQYA